MSHMQPPNVTITASDEPEFVSVRKAAAELGMTPYSVSKLLDAGEIESEYVQRRRVRWASVKAYLKDRAS